MKALMIVCSLGILADYWTTVWAIARFGIRAEANQIVSLLIEKCGTEGFLVAKIMAIVLLWRIYPGFRKGDRKVCWVDFATVLFLSITQWLAVCNNLWQMRIAMAMGW